MAPPSASWPLGHLGQVGARLKSLSPRARWGLGGGAAAVLLAGVLALALLLPRRPAGAPSGSRKLAEQQWERARVALQKGRLQEAQELLGEIQKLDPALDTRPLSSRLLVDRKAKLSMDLVEGLVAQGRFDDARAELARTPEGDESFRARHEALVASVEKAQTLAALQGFDQALSRRDFPAAEAALGALPRDMQGDLKARLARERQRADEDAADEAARRDAARKRREEAQAERRRMLAEEVFATVSHRLDEQDFTRAALECDRIMERYHQDPELRERAVRVKGQVPVLQRNLKDGQAKLDAHAVEGAVKPLRLAHDVYYTYMGMAGELGRKLDQMLATALLATGSQALADSDYAGGLQALREVLKLSPDSEQAQKAQGALDALDARAETLYEEAVQLKDHDLAQATARLRRALRMTDAGSRVHQKAKRLLKVLQG